MEQALTARPLRLTRRRKRVLAQVADPGVVLGAAVAEAAIAGSLPLNRKMILRVPKKLGDEDQEVIRNWGRVPIFIGRVPKQKLGRLSTFLGKGQMKSLTLLFASTGKFEFFIVSINILLLTVSVVSVDLLTIKRDFLLHLIKIKLQPHKK
jgi:hypothetical protein